MRRIAAVTVALLIPALLTGTSRASVGPGDPPGSFAYRRSLDGGGSFAAGQLDDRNRDITTTHLAAEGGLVHAVFEDNSETAPGGRNDRAVYYRRSGDGGITYSPSVRLDNTGGDSSESDIDVVGDDVFIVWEDDRLLDSGEPDPATGDIPPDGEAIFDNRDDIFFTRSDNQGRSFAAALNLTCEASPRAAGETSADDPTPPAGRCDSDEVHNRDARIAASDDGKTVVVVYEATDLISGPESAGDFTQGDDVFVSVSRDAGASWDIRNHNLSDEPQRQLGPAVAVSEAAIHVVYQNEADRETKETNRSIQYTRSADGGATFEPVRSLPGPAARTAAVRAQGRTVHVVGCEQDREAEKGSRTWDLLYWRSTDEGTTWDKPKTLASHADGCGNPEMALSGDSVHVVYESDVEPLDSDVFYLRSDNVGADWTKRWNLSNNPLGASSHPSIAVDPIEPRSVHVGWNDDAGFLLVVSGGQDLPDEEGRPVRVEDEDVVRYRGGTYSLVLDGSDVDLGALSIDALARLSEREFVLSFAEPGVLPGLGEVDDADLVRFTADRLGPDTAGAFELYFDGSDIGLGDEDIDAVEVVASADGVDLYLSTTENFAVEGGLTGTGADVFVCAGAGTGEASTCGEIRPGVSLDPREVGGVDAFSFDGAGIQPGEDAVAHFSFDGPFKTAKASGDDRDIVLCRFNDLPETLPEQVLPDCGKRVPLLMGVPGAANGLTHDVAALEFDF